MKRLAFTLTIIALAGAAWTAFEPFRIKHPASGKDITVPGQNGPNALLVSGWKTTPAGRQLAVGRHDPQRPGQPRRQTLRLHQYGLHASRAAHRRSATEKEIATFPMEQAWSGLAFSPKGDRIYVSNGAGYKASDIQFFDHWDKEAGRRRASATRLYGALKDQTAVSWLGTSR